MNAKQAKRVAIWALNARRSSRGYTYVESGATWLVSAKDLTRLGYLWASEHKPVAYRMWAQTSAAKLVSV
jgi:hypothetical protein